MNDFEPPKENISRKAVEQMEKLEKQEELKTSNAAGAIMVCWFISFVVFVFYLMIRGILNPKYTTNFDGFYLTFPAAFALYFLYKKYSKIQTQQTDDLSVSIVPRLISFLISMGCVAMLIIGCVIQYTAGMSNINQIRQLSHYKEINAVVVSNVKEIVKAPYFRGVSTMVVRFNINHTDFTPTIRREFEPYSRPFQDKYTDPHFNWPNHQPGESINLYVNPTNVHDHILLGKHEYFTTLLYDCAPLLLIIVGLGGILYSIRKRDR
ncbi:MAG: hypothetical protein AB7I18_02165 [Candidatus Berkiella sp.]